MPRRAVRKSKHADLVSALIALIGVALVACGGDDAPARHGSSGTGSGGSECAFGSLDGGACETPGVPAADCADGFMVDAPGSCTAVLPADACPEGTMAVPGDMACRDVAPCGDGTWGSIPVDAATEFVDIGYAGPDPSDGSKTRPWSTIQAGIDHAAAGAIVAVASGSYLEDVVITSAPVRLWGRCPAMVEIVGSATSTAAIAVLEETASSAEIHDIGVRGARDGIDVVGAESVTIDGVWVHDTGDRGIDVEDAYGPTSITIAGSLVERAREMGVFVLGATATVQASVVRATQPLAGNAGRGVNAEEEINPTSRSTLTVRGSVLEGNTEVALYVAGSDATIEGTVVRQTMAGVAGHGIGIEVHDGPSGDPAKVGIRTAIVEDSVGLGILGGGSELSIQSSVVRRTATATDGKYGGGIQVQRTSGGRTNLTVRGVLVDTSHEVALAVAGSDALIEGVLLRGTDVDAMGNFGRGLAFQADKTTGDPAEGAVRGSLIDGNREAGIFIVRSHASIDAVVVQGTLPNGDGRFGDGIALVADGGAASADITAARIEGNARAGLSSFGATVNIGATSLLCNGFDFEGEAYEGQTFEFDTAGGNLCGCPHAAGDCQVQSQGLDAPDALPLSSG